MNTTTYMCTTGKKFHSQTSQIYHGLPSTGKKIQYCVTNICSYNCTVEYVEGKKKSCGDTCHIDHQIVMITMNLVALI